DNKLRSWSYNEIWNYSSITAVVKDESLDEKQVFKIYYDFSEKISKLHGYQVLALNRGEKMGVLKVNFEHNLEKMFRFFAVRFKETSQYIDDLIVQTVKKKIVPAMERRIRTELS
ncbi:RNA-binding transcriptional accessory protein, partial [Streptococcus sp. SPC0]|nr:RNA-binding transcriptional accessory protein [Streptococcus sp. SPC0]